MTMSMMTSEELEALPFSVSTNLSKLAHRYLRTARLGGPAWEFCSLLHDRTFGDAGYHRQNGHREYWCQFDLARWAAELEIAKSNLQRIMAALQACDIIFYEPDQNNPGSGRVGWNIHFEEWQRYDGRRAKARLAEAPRKQPSILILPGNPPEGTSANHGGNEASLPERTERRLDLPARKISTSARFHAAEPHQINMVGRSEPQKISVPACSKINMGASSEASPQAGPPDPLRKETKEKKTEEIAKAPAAANDAPAVPPGALCWPARRTSERDLDYYQRILLDASEPNAVKLLMRLAFEKIGVALSHANYGRMTTLARKHRPSMMVRHILHAAGDHIDKDPMDYLTWLANGKQREERNNGRAGTQRRETYQPGKERVAAADSSPGCDPVGNTWGGYTHRVVEV